MSKSDDVGQWILVSSLRQRAADMRGCELRARAAYHKPGPLRDACLRLAEIYARAAELFKAELGQIEFVDDVPQGPDPRTRPKLDPDAMNRARARVGMPPLTEDPHESRRGSGELGIERELLQARRAALLDPPPAALVGVVYCKNCGGKTTAFGDEYGPTTEGLNYDQFQCDDCRATTFVELGTHPARA